MANPFEAFDLDPNDGIGVITQRLKELAEDATSDAERERIRAAWEELTLHPQRRIRAALFTYPETRRALGEPPPMRRVIRSSKELDVRDITARPSVLASLGLPMPESLDAPSSLDDDPLLHDTTTE